MKLIVGLGNPESKYNFTRHNVGFLALDFYAKVKGMEWAEKWGGVYAEITNGEKVILVKPQGYYNNSGEAVAAFARFYKLAPEDILVICDDFNLEFGKLRLRHGGSAGGNNGLKSVAEKLATEAFLRLRIGTANDELRRKIGDTDFVLGKFSAEEKERFPEILREVVLRMDEFIAGKA